MQREFIQEKSLNMTSGNAEKSLNIDLSAKSRLIPYSNTASMLGLNDLYLEERDACENYRMIFTVNPICTNVLYNAVTEPVYMEGSYSALSLVESSVSLSDTNIFSSGTLSMSGVSGENDSYFDVDHIYAVRNTEFSHELIGDFKYHCGYDIFNNHLLRTNEFEHAMLENKGKNKSEFNSIFDFAVDFSGNTVMRVIGEADGPAETEVKKSEIRMYQLDNIKSLSTAFYDGLRNLDGWFGFYNTGYINIPNGKLKDMTEVSVNRVLNNESPCSFVDFYPDRTLFSFIPKVNRYKKRIERNWDCSIVYPYKSDYDMFNRIMVGFSGTSDEWGSSETGDTGWKHDNSEKICGGVRVLGTKVVYNNVGDELIEFHSMLRHTIEPGDTVRLFYAPADDSDIGYGELKIYNIPVTVISIGNSKGDEENRYFTIKLTDISTFCGIMPTPEGETPKRKSIGLRGPDGQITETPIVFFYKKIENGYDNKYYFRKFRKIKNFEYVVCDLDNEEEMEEAKKKAVRAIKEPTVINEKSPDYILLGDVYIKKVSRQLNYTQNKIAFAENIYGDRVAQVIFNDDICVTGLRDNIGRPLSKLYFTAIKTNRGYREWYNSGLTQDDAVEFSHCFGDVTSGLDLPDDDFSTDFNVRKLYNIFSGECQNQEEYLDGLMLALEDAPVGHFIDGTPLPIESGITMDNFDEFFGDVIEFSKVSFIEKTIEKVYHRFNTAQRECLLNEKYYDINYDELVGDLYDVGEIMNN